MVKPFEMRYNNPTCVIYNPNKQSAHRRTAFWMSKERVGRNETEYTQFKRITEESD